MAEISPPVANILDDLDITREDLAEMLSKRGVRIAELEAALKPFADAVCRDNGDVTITHVDPGYYLRAKRLLGRSTI